MAEHIVTFRKQAHEETESQKTRPEDAHRNMTEDMAVAVGISHPVIPPRLTCPLYSA